MESFDRSSARDSSLRSSAQSFLKTDAVQKAIAEAAMESGSNGPSLATILSMKAPNTPIPAPIKRIAQIQQKSIMRGHADEVSCLKFSPDSLHLASGSGDSSVRLWSPEGGHLENIFAGHKGKVHSIGYIGSGTILFSAAKDKQIIAWDMIKIGTQRLSIMGHSNVVWDVILNKDGTRAISCSHDETVKQWDTMSGALLKSIKGHTSTIYSLSLNEDGKTLATGSADKTIKIWDLDTGACLKTLHGHSSHVTAVQWVPGSPNTLVSSCWDETVMLWDVSSGDSLHTFVGHNAKVNCVAVSPDGDCVISGGEDKSVKVWKISTLECFKTLTGHKEEVLSVAVSPDGKYIASGSMDKTIILYTTTLV